MQYNPKAKAKGRLSAAPNYLSVKHTLRSLCLELLIIKVGVVPALLHELAVGAALDYPAVTHHQYHVGLAYGGQSVGN